MHCFVYASQRKADTYVWLQQRDNFKPIPASLAMLLGDLRFVLEVELHAQRRLPHEDVEVVMEHLRTQGWHLQLPPQQTLAAPPATSDADAGLVEGAALNRDDAPE
ncbi:YcgL domain-containing protein [Dyella acidiphila]|uniref:YcgL domain-containing protein n=1 Tax=Dyella acidiphila TaxID=2775866 RepID=A0ABR9G866_9GAMM|nr:YcgL domain-containing protein [Dyella acidiphila]MBE1160212.1 YcgL domain-containing protein [Dyella acidiphila]